MSEAIKTGWLKDKGGNKFAPKTLESQIQDANGVSLETKLGGILKEIKDKIEELFKLHTQEAVDKWLDEHPEATTTVQDHSLTVDKLVIGTLGYTIPEMFGAKGDGITDDTVAIQSAIDSGVLIICRNNYRISSQLVVPSNRTLIFSGTVTHNSVDFANLSQFFNLNGSTNVKIIGGNFISQRDKGGEAPTDHQRQNMLSSNVGLFQANGGVDGLYLEGVKTNNLSTSTFREGNNLIVRDCVFDNALTAFYIDKSTNIVFENTTVANATELGDGDHCLYFGENNENITISNCHFSSDEYSGALVDLTAGGRTPSDAVRYPKNVKITGCYFKGATALNDYCENLVVDNCDIDCTNRMSVIMCDTETIYTNCRIKCLYLVYAQSNQCTKRLKFLNCKLDYESNTFNSELFTPTLEFDYCEINCKHIAYYNNLGTLVVKNSKVVCSDLFVTLKKKASITIINCDISCTIVIDNSSTTGIDVLAKFSTFNNSSHFVYPTTTEKGTYLSCYDKNNMLIS